MKVIFGELKAQWARITVDDKLVKSPYLYSNLIRYLPQTVLFPKGLSCQEVFSIFDLSPESKDKIQNVLELPKVSSVSNLSFGQMRAFELLVLLYSNPKFLLLDEPFTGLSPKWIETIIPLIKERSTEMGIFITDHQWSSVLNISDRFYLMDKGNLRECFSKNQIQDSSYLNAVAHG